LFPISPDYEETTVSWTVAWSELGAHPGCWVIPLVYGLSGFQVMAANEIWIYFPAMVRFKCLCKRPCAGYI